VVGGTCLVALAGLEVVQRLVPATSRQPHNDVAGFIYAALGVIYAVLLALVVIAVWEEYDAASVTVEQEANAVAEIAMEHPFSGGARIGTEAFDLVLERLETSKLSDLS
jgi:hypothetical protein